MSRDQLVDYFSREFEKKMTPYFIALYKGDYQEMIRLHTHSYEKRRQSVLESIQHAKDHYVPKYGRSGPHIGLKGLANFERDLVVLEEEHAETIANVKEKGNF